MDILTAKQKTRHIFTGNPMEEPHFQHVGDQVVRLLTGGSLPDAWVTFHHSNE
jgi:hypothetical protein